MKIILLQDVRKLGRAGDIAQVSDGFARNYLFPQKLAEPMTSKGLEHSQSLKLSREQDETQSIVAITKAFARLQSAELEFALPGDKNGHLYTGLKESEILAKINGGDDTLPKTLKLTRYVPLKQTGRHEICLEGPQKQSMKLTISITCKK